MTDKPIIIDDVDVSECEYFCKWNSKCSLFNCAYGGGNPVCDNGSLSDCHYKMYKRKDRILNDIKEYAERYLGSADRYYILKMMGEI